MAHHNSSVATILSIAGSDSGGGAGIQADIKAISANGAYAATVITALTAQNTQGVQGVALMEPEFIKAQMDSVLSDLNPDAIKIGMVGGVAQIQQIAQSLADFIKDNKPCPIVLDPVMIAKSGDPLLMEDAISCLKQELIPLATIITPNLPEAALLADQPIPNNREGMGALAETLAKYVKGAILLKGGHLSNEDSPDLLWHNGEAIWLESKRLQVKNCHGTGCTLSAALAARLGQYFDWQQELPEACKQAKAYLTKALATADKLEIGHGIGPVDHFGLAADKRNKLK